jgi:prophage maintenance system killer protein
MKEPYWLTREECLTLHDMMLSQYGSIPGVRDENLMESALARPQQLFVVYHSKAEFCVRTKADRREMG